jgi:hypothetical protein
LHRRCFACAPPATARQDFVFYFLICQAHCAAKIKSRDLHQILAGNVAREFMDRLSVAAFVIAVIAAMLFPAAQALEDNG